MRKWRRAPAAAVALCVSLAVGSCGGGSRWGDSERLPTQALLAVPPATYFQYATPQIAAEIDYETLNGPGTMDPGTPVPPIEPQPTELASAEPIEPEPEPDQLAEPAPEEPAVEVPKPKPGATVIKAVAVPFVRGSPGKGNAELTEAMRHILKEAGWPVLHAPREDALIISGRVKLEPAAGDTQKVGLSWTVYSPDGSVLGAVKQSNDIPSGSLSRSWGDTAVHATEAAATGIFDLVRRFR